MVLHFKPFWSVKTPQGFIGLYKALHNSTGLSSLGKLKQRTTEPCRACQVYLWGLCTPQEYEGWKG